MSDFPEVRAILLRRACGITGFVCLQTLIMLLDWLGDWVSIERSQFTPTGQYERRPDGGAQLILPITANDDAEVRFGIHELGHGLLDLPPVERQEDGAVLPTALTRQLDRRDEEECFVFVDALRLPRHLVSAYLGCAQPDWEGLIADSGCTRQEIERRLRWMQTHPAPQVPQPPPWSAWHHHRLYEDRGQRSCALIAAPLAGGPELSIPYRNPVEYRRLRAQLLGSLAALRPHEFRLKYGPDRVTRSPLYIHWDEWRESVQLLEEHC